MDYQTPTAPDLPAATGASSPRCDPGRAEPALPSAEEVLGYAGGENFPVALRFLPARLRNDLLAIYGFARLVDQIGDAYPGDRLGALDEIVETLDRAFGAKPATEVPISQPQRLVSRATEMVRSCQADPAALYDLVEANRADQTTTSYETFEDLVGYCRYSANPVGRLVLAALGYSAARCDPLRFESLSVCSDAVCTALQIAEHCQDIREDALSGRVYMPAEDLERFGVERAELCGSGPASTALRALVCFEAARARRLLGQGAPLVAALRGWGRLAVAGFVGGGQATLDALASANFDPLANTVVPSPRRIAYHSARLVLQRASVQTPGNFEVVHRSRCAGTSAGTSAGTCAGACAGTQARSEA